MAKYALLADALDPALTVEERHLDKADVFVDALLHERGIDPEAVTLPLALLTELAVAHALRLAAIEGAIGDNSPLIAKAREYEKTAALLAKSLSREALGLAVVSGAGYGNVVLGRG